MKRTTCSATALSLLLLPAGSLLAGQGQGTLGVSVQVVLHHRPQLAQSLPVPEAAHLMIENANGRHYAFDGSVETARDYYHAQMRDQGYDLQAEQSDEANDDCEMRWRRKADVIEIRMRAALGGDVTRISVRAMTESRAHAPG